MVTLGGPLVHVTTLFFLSLPPPSRHRVWIQKRLRVYVQNVPVCTGNTSTRDEERQRKEMKEKQILLDNVSNQKNPPDELAHNVSTKNRLETNLDRQMHYVR